MRASLTLAVVLCAASAHAQWVQLGPQTGSVSAVVADPSVPGRLYLGTLGGGIFRSDDQGATWTQVGITRPDSVDDFSADPSTPGIVFAATNLGLLETDAGGAVWNVVPTGLVGPAVALVTLAQDPSAPGTLYVGSNVGTINGPPQVLKTPDYGNTWQTLTLPPAMTTVGALAVDPMRPQTVYAGTSCCMANVFRSDDGGADWNDGGVGMGIGGVRRLAVDPVTTSNVWAAAAAGLYASTDFGDTWQLLDAGFTQVPMATVVLDRTAPATVYATTQSTALSPPVPRIYKTTNGGATWSDAGIGLTSDVTGLAIDRATATRLYAGTLGGGFFVSTNGGANWSASNSGLFAAWITTLAVDPNLPQVLVAGTQYTGGFFSGDRGLSWSPNGLGTTVTVLSLGSDGGLAVADQTLYATGDHGASWTPVASAIDAGLPAFSAVAFSTSQGSTAYAGTCFSGIYVTNDTGQNWTLTNFTDAGLACIQGMAVDPYNPAIAVAAAGGGAALEGVFITFDGGGGWQPSNTTLPPGVSPGPLAVDAPADGGARFYLGTNGGGGGVFVSVDDGQTWTVLASIGGDIQALVANPVTHAVYATNGTGLQRTLTQGQVWDNLSAGLPNRNISAVIPGSQPDEVYIGTYASGVFALANDAGILPDGGGTTGGNDGGLTIPDSGSTSPPDAGGAGDAGSSRGSGVKGLCGCGPGAMPAWLLVVLAAVWLVRRPRLWV